MCNLEDTGSFVPFCFLEVGRKQDLQISAPETRGRRMGSVSCSEARSNNVTKVLCLKDAPSVFENMISLGEFS